MNDLSQLYFQQGDVLLYPIDFTGLEDPVTPIPNESVKLKTSSVQEGEHTGHAHRLSGSGYTIYEQPRTKRKHLRVISTSTLTHEEHLPQEIPPGDYEVRIIREKDHFNEMVRPVID